MGVYPGEGNGEELIPALTPIGNPGSLSEFSFLLDSVSNVHCKKKHVE